ncbi:type VI secretion system lipoprotein TssJ [Lysobacter sp. 5GHs7-4]|uniref:type VI secretion system lipoprotein TssJ n=1 Tax=Lysobacter sp. 5GHs7-4 TaxID=2904253 RepID=UPI001E4A7185|nr:type VI secretion system lipoprotein TssJ [Lysobacter sp. 5GHs7-4]UHQ21453.1 type VI secretion system lipoprotein TssJ [Lysobacter sp. 5GHs7-4]
MDLHSFRHIALAMFCSASVLALSGCGKAMELAGLKTPQPKEKAVPLELLAAQNLNAGNGKKGLALVVKVYQLKSTTAFDQAPYSAFLDENSEKAALGADLVKVTEILVMPGQDHELIERVAPDAGQVGIVALFRTPAAVRWRFTFDTKKAAKSGIRLGLHACAMTTTSAEALTTKLATEVHSLSGAPCPRG